MGAEVIAAVSRIDIEYARVQGESAWLFSSMM